MKMLNGLDMAGFIQERQAKQVRGLRQAAKVIPKLAVVVTVDNPVIDTYMRMKQKYGAEILVDVDILPVDLSSAPSVIAQLNEDDAVHGIIVQLPLSDPDQTEKIINLVSPQKDVDGLGKQARLDPATPTAILWLLAGYDISLEGKKILIVGRGKLVGEPLGRMLEASGHDVSYADRSTPDLATACREADIIVTATGSPSIISPDMLKSGAVVVDAGVASEEGKIVGDLAPDVYEREDLVLTPAKGGVGPLTICALFENVLIAARRLVS